MLGTWGGDRMIRKLGLQRAAVREATRPQAPVDDAPEPLRETYSSLTEAMGRRHEVLRTRCEDAVGLLESMKQAPEAIAEIFRDFADLATELQQKTLQAQELTTAFASLRETETATRADLGETRRRASELEIKLAGANLSYQDSVNETRGLLETVKNLENTLQERNVEIGGQARELNAVRSQHATLLDEALKLRSRVAELATGLADAESERRTLRDRLMVESEERLKQARSQEDLERQYIQAKKAFGESSASEEKNRNRIAALESELEKVGAENAALRDSLQEARARMETDAASYESKIEAIRSRVRLTETLLAQARDEARRAHDEQMRLGDASDRLVTTQSALEEAQHERARASEQISELEKSRDALIGRANELLSRLKERQFVGEQANKQIDNLKDQVARVRAFHEQEVEKLSGQMRVISDGLAKERSERAYAEGALETARKDRMQLQRVIASLKEGVKPPQGVTSIEAAMEAPDDALQTPTLSRPREASARG
ncbi:MAG: hypothetical protein JWN93_2974 [Hyphomicrobiales bacterium]|nr:hypothetical protein [Hyphomicrobiales bacterium]